MNLDVITERKLPDLPPRFALYAGAAVGVLATGLAILLAAGGGESAVESSIARQAEGVRQTTQRLSSLFEPRAIPVDLGSPAPAALHGAPQDLTYVAGFLASDRSTAVP